MVYLLFKYWYHRVYYSQGHELQMKAEPQICIIKNKDIRNPFGQSRGYYYEARGKEMERERSKRTLAQ